MRNIIITLSEGQDDIAFLSRILYVKGFEKYDKKLNDFIVPFNGLFSRKLAEKEINSFGFVSPGYLVPSVVLIKEETYIFLHNLGGDNNSRGTEIKTIIQMYEGLKSDDDDFSSYDFEYRFLFFFDADERGVEDRENSVSELLEKELKHNEIKNNYGLYIFHKDGNGTLEDLLMELMKKGNESEFENAQEYIEKNKFDDEERCKEYVCSNTDERHKGGSKFYEKKSIISVAGQLQFSAKSNSVIIEKSDYIQKDDLVTNQKCKEIADMFVKDL
jgi:Trp operon repressor